jgi:hypothetical protein
LTPIRLDSNLKQKQTKGKTMQTNINNKESWIWSFDQDKNISIVVASLLTGHYEYDCSINERPIAAICAVHNINKTQAKKAIQLANEYIKNKEVA